jgi:hypothetical protein
MFEEKSRYSGCEDATFVTEDGQALTYKRRRFLPQGEKMPALAEVTILAGDRLDVIAARHVGDPEQYWRICDANNAMHPLEMTSEPGRTIKIASPW